MSNRWPIVGVIAALILFIVYSSLFVVNEREQAIVLRFGEIVDVKTEPGIYFKAPFSFFDAEALELVSEVSPGGEITLPLIFTVNTLLHAASPEDRWIATRTLGELVTIRGISPPAEPAFCSWEEISVMESSGVDIGTMGHRHLFFTSISPESAISM